MYLAILTHHSWRIAVGDTMASDVTLELSPPDYKGEGGPLAQLELSHHEAKLLSTLIGATEVTNVTLLAEGAKFRLTQVQDTDRILVVDALPKEDAPLGRGEPITVSLPLTDSDSVCVAGMLRQGAHEGEINEDAVTDQEEELLEGLVTGEDEDEDEDLPRRRPGSLGLDLDENV